MQKDCKHCLFFKDNLVSCTLESMYFKSIFEDVTGAEVDYEVAKRVSKLCSCFSEVEDCPMFYNATKDHRTMAGFIIDLFPKLSYEQKLILLGSDTK